MQAKQPLTVAQQMQSGVYAKPYNGHFQPIYNFFQQQQAIPQAELTMQQQSIL